MGSLTEELALSLLNFEQPKLEVGTLDTLVQFFYHGRPGSAEVGNSSTHARLCSIVSLVCSALFASLHTPHASIPADDKRKLPAALPVANNGRRGLEQVSGKRPSVDAGASDP